MPLRGRARAVMSGPTVYERIRVCQDVPGQVSSVPKFWGYEGEFHQMFINPIFSLSAFICL